MNKPLVAIIGRPNVGKSSFFNKVCGKRISIVDNIPGVTRDRVYADAEWCGHNFTVIDTGGLDDKSEDYFQANIKEQVNIAVDLASVVVFMVDGREGLTQKDYEVASYIRKTKKPVVLVVNKLDNNEIEKSFDFYNLGFGEPFVLSCEQSKGIGDILDEIVKNFKTKYNEADEDKIVKIAVVGRPNGGKSSLINKILGEDRVVVSNIAGTTRDAIDSTFKYNGEDYMIIDTAGLRRKRGVENGTIESYSVLRSYDAIERADIVLIVFDASEEISEQDVRIAGYVHEKGKPTLILMNKWDKVEKNYNSINEYDEKLRKSLSFMDYFKSLYISAKEGTRLQKIMPTVLEILENSNRRISTGTLNELLSAAMLSNEPPYRNGRKLKISYITQVEVHPPTFILFCNDASLMHFSYQRYLENRFRDAVNFEGTPIKFILRNNSKEKD